MPGHLVFGQAEKPEQCKYEMTVSGTQRTKPRCGLAKGHTGLHWVVKGDFAGRPFNSSGEERPRPESTLADRGRS